MNEDKLRKEAWLALVKWLDALQCKGQQDAHGRIADHTLALLATTVGLRK